MPNPAIAVQMVRPRSCTTGGDGGLWDRLEAVPEQRFRGNTVGHDDQLTERVVRAGLGDAGGAATCGEPAGVIAEGERAAGAVLACETSGTVICVGDGLGAARRRAGLSGGVESRIEAGLGGSDLGLPLMVLMLPRLLRVRVTFPSATVPAAWSW